MVDINDMSTQQEVVNVDYNQVEEFFKPTLLDDGKHRANMKLGDRGINGPSKGDKAPRQKDKASGQRTGAFLVNVHVMLEALGDSDEKIGVCFDNLSSALMGSLSRLHAALYYAGVPPTSGIGPAELETEVQNAFAQPLTVGIVTQWQAQWEDTSKPEGSKDRYKVFKKGMTKFPPILDAERQFTGKYSPEVFYSPAVGGECSEDSPGAQPVRAQVKVIEYFKA